MSAPKKNCFAPEKFPILFAQKQLNDSCSLSQINKTSKRAINRSCKMEKVRRCMFRIMEEDLKGLRACPQSRFEILMNRYVTSQFNLDWILEIWLVLDGFFTTGFHHQSLIAETVAVHNVPTFNLQPFWLRHSVLYNNFLNRRLYKTESIYYGE